MNRYDVLLAPTCAVRVPQANGPYSLLAEEELDVWINRLVDAARYTIPANETGLPAISVPAGLDSDGLPIGAQFYGNFTGEDLLQPQITTAVAWYFIQHNYRQVIPAGDFPRLSLLSARAETLAPFRETAY